MALNQSNMRRQMLDWSSALNRTREEEDDNSFIMDDEDYDDGENGNELGLCADSSVSQHTRSRWGARPMWPIPMIDEARRQVRTNTMTSYCRKAKGKANWNILQL